MRRTAKVIGAAGAAAVLLLGGASQAGASTIGVPNVGTIQISGAGVMGPGPAPPYDTRVSGNLDGSTAHYASEAGFLTEVSIAHWNTDPVTVKILVLSRGSADFLNVVQAPMTMVLPAAPSNAPLVTTQTVPAPTTIAVGDRIGMSYISGTSTLHALVSNASPTAVPGGFPSPLPNSEPGVGTALDMVDTISGPLIEGTVSATPSTPVDPGQLAPRSKPAAVPPKDGTNYKVGKKKVRVLVGCSGLGIQVRCTGTAEVEIDFGGGASSAAAKPLGSTTYDIPDGATQALTIPLTKAAVRKLGKKGKLNAFLVLTEQYSTGPVTSGSRITLKSKKAKPKK